MQSISQTKRYGNLIMNLRVRFVKLVAFGVMLGILGQAALLVALKDVKPLVESTNAWGEGNP